MANDFHHTDTPFQALLEAAPDAMIIVDERGNIHLVNAQAERLFGYDRRDLIGHPIEVLVPERYRPAHRGHRLGYFNSAHPRPMGPELALYALRQDGTEVPVEISLSPLVTEQGTLVISTVRDVSDRKRADAQFRALLESAPDAMVIVNAEGVIVLVNAQTERLFGFKREELLGNTVEILVPERYGDVHTRHRLDYFAGAHPRPMGRGLDLFGRRKDGSEFPVEISLSPLETQEGLLVASAIRDISDRKAAEAERARLREERATHAEANRIKDEFLATLSHELRTPLNAVLGWIDLVTRGVVKDEELNRALLTIRRNARAQAQLVEDLLDISRIVSGKLQIRPAALDLVEVAEAALDVVRPAADAKSIKLIVTGGHEPLLIIGDADRLQQVVWNLLSNAVKFTPTGGEVELQMRSVDGGVELVVRDTGDGIAPTFLPYVFDRFRQENSTTTRPHGGLGLGLSIAKSIIERHGGSIAAESAGVGHGATFRVFLPVAHVAERRKVRRSSTDVSALRGAPVLIVDDREDDRVLLMRIFQHAGAAVWGAASASEALQSVASVQPQLLVSDLAMPGDDGYALIRRLRATSEFQSICAIAVTAHARPEDRDAALAAGFDAYVSKPVDTDTLLRRAAELFWAGCRGPQSEG